MSSGGVQVPRPPDGLRPGQLGVVLLGRVIIGDIAATLVDLSVRKLLRVEAAGDDNSGGWQVTSLLGSVPQHRRESLLKYEEILLGGLSSAGSPASLASLAGQLARTLGKTRDAVIHDAVHRGWLRHLHHSDRTQVGEDLALRIRSFQRSLMHVKSEGAADMLEGALLPYALHFGLAESDRTPLSRFAHAWVDTFKDQPGWAQPAAPPRRELDLERVDRPTIDDQIRQMPSGLIWLS